jgi:hypothetical protein
MAHLNGFNANQVEPNVSFDPIPAGKYVAAITESEAKPTKNGSGNYLQLTFTILEGEYKDRMVWARLCLDHPNQQTVKIARAQLSAICHAVGVMTPGDSAELHNIPLVVKVKCKKREDTGDVVNEATGYAKRETTNAAKPAQPPAQQAAAPWARK